MAPDKFKAPLGMAKRSFGFHGGIRVVIRMNSCAGLAFRCCETVPYLPSFVVVTVVLGFVLYRSNQLRK